MVKEAREEYLRALHALSKADAAKWATFVEAFKMFTLYEYERALSSRTDEALVNVGMGRRMRDLRDDFIHIDALASRLGRVTHGSI